MTAKTGRLEGAFNPVRRRRAGAVREEASLSLSALVSCAIVDCVGLQASVGQAVEAFIAELMQGC